MESLGQETKAQCTASSLQKFCREGKGSLGTESSVGSKKKRKFFQYSINMLKGFPGGSVVKNLPANVGGAAPSLGWENPLEKEMATHSSILAWEIPWIEEPGGLQSLRSQKRRTRLSA